MEDKYKSDLEKLRAGKNSNSAFSTYWNYEARAKAEESGNKTSEKEQVLQSLESFTDKKISESGDNKFAFPGGEVTVQEVKQLEYQVGDDLNVEVFNAPLTSHLQPSIESNIKIVFLADELRPESLWSEDYINCFFDEQVGVLLKRMIAAMNINEDEYKILPTAHEGVSLDQVATYIYKSAPMVVISLGARSTHQFLKIDEPLRDIHGEFYKVDIKGSEQKTFDVMPLFSPKLLHSAPNMKKIAWEDMQKAMQKLN